MEAVRIKSFESFNPTHRQRILQEVKRLEKRTFPSSEAFDFDTELSKNNTRLNLALASSNGNDEIIGYIVFVRMKRLTLLHKVCVAPRLRRQGIAKHMVSNLVVRLKDEGCSSIQLWVDEARTPARELYSKLSFVELGRCHDYYGPGRTGVKLVLHLE